MDSLCVGMHGFTMYRSAVFVPVLLASVDNNTVTNVYTCANVEPVDLW